jgi:hypothetical protein
MKPTTKEECKLKLITIKNCFNNSRSLLQLSYTHVEQCPDSQNYKPIGVNTILNAPNIIECVVPAEKYMITEKNELITKTKWFSTIRLFDPASKEKKIKLKITNNKEPIIIHPLDEKTKKVCITKGGKELAAFTYS